MKTFEPIAGQHIEDAIRQAIYQAGDDTVSFSFNGIAVRVRADSDPQLIVRDCMRQISQTAPAAIVGPYPAETLTDAELRYEQQAIERRLAEDSARRAEEEDRRLLAKQRLDDVLANCGPLELRDGAAWELHKAANVDAYGARVIQYAEDVGRLIQLAMDGDGLDRSVVDYCQSLADWDGVTGYMIGVAMQILRECWRYGGQLPERSIT